MPYIMTLVSLFAADSIIKCWIEKNWVVNQTCNHKIVIKKYHNRGAMFNIGDKNQDLVAILSLVLSAFVSGVFAAVLHRKQARVQKIGLALILGGAYSNTYDRLKRKYVVDYFSVLIETKRIKNRFLRKFADKINTMVFNLADFGIMIGAILFVMGEWNGGQE
ncbi:MAG: signal peptidase II [Lachnospiraceae bacterium]